MAVNPFQVHNVKAPCQNIQSQTTPLSHRFTGRSVGLIDQTGDVGHQGEEDGAQEPCYDGNSQYEAPPPGLPNDYRRKTKGSVVKLV